jgi:phosphoribosyl-AMP cyclohydrolase / phosphoribosyl-ATP pyrophosphohydrolase
LRPAGADLTLEAGVLLPCVVQDASSGDVLMVAWVDDEALAATRRTGLAHFHSRSRDELWAKGASSGNTMAVESIAIDCDRDTLLMRVRPTGPACHTGAETCFGPRPADPRAGVLPEIAAVIEERRRSGDAGSYVARVLRAPREVAQRKVGEEAVEVLLAPVAGSELVGEIADLWFHSMVLLARDGLDPLAPLEVLARRRRGGEAAGHAGSPAQ